MSRLQSYKVWDPEDGDEADAVTMQQHFGSHAAEAFVENNYEGERSRTVLVRDESGKVETYEVECRPTVEFHASAPRAWPT